MPKKAMSKSSAKCCGDMKKSGDKASKMPFVPFKKGEKPDMKNGKK